jgi:hypothetical protein
MPLSAGFLSMLVTARKEPGRRKCAPRALALALKSWRGGYKRMVSRPRVPR